MNYNNNDKINMDMNEIDAGCYKLTTTKETTKGLKIEEYIVLISGYRPFLKIESLWSIKNKCFVNDDILRAVETKYEKII